MSASVDNLKADPNLTPMLDMVFQLITFFMLVINLRAASVDPTIQLPRFGSARPTTSGNPDVIILNVDAKGVLNVGGQPHDADTLLRHEAETALAKRREVQPDIVMGDDLPTTIVLRADRTTEFSDLNRVMMACQQVGFRNVSLKVLDGNASASPVTR